MSRRASRLIRLARRTVSRRPRIEALEPRELLTAFSVTSGADSGPNTLRAAIIAANGDNSGGVDSISFNLAGTGVQTISLLSSLPAIGRAVTVDATTQTGYSGSPLVVLDGTNAGAGVNGLTFGAGTGSAVKGLSIVGFTGGASGIVLNGSSSATTVEADYLGILPDGQTTRPNSNGVAITTVGNLIGMPGQANANLISGNLISGVLVAGPGATNNLLANNLIGTDKTGFFALGNHYGVTLAGSDNTIGGLTSASRNLISGNVGPTGQDGVGILFQGASTGDVVQGNYIGTNNNIGLGGVSSGAVPNVYGIYFVTTGGSNPISAAQETIGGTVAGAGNVISGNVVGITGNLTTSLIAGNTIGLAGAAGSAAIPNGAGILLGASATTIGGTVAAARNVISASSGTNNASGIGLELSGDSDLIQGNYIGPYLTSASGLPANAALRNKTGVSLHTINSTIGGTAQGAGNVISGNVGDGLVLDNNGSNLIQGNSVGLTPDLQGPLPNGGSGIVLRLTAPTTPPTQPLALNDTIGGTVAGAGNTVANNVGSNIIVRGSYPTGFTGLSIRGNSIFGNQLPGIDLAGNGLPVPPRLFITQVNVVNMQDLASGYFQGQPSTTYTVDVFGIRRDAPILSSNDGPGQVYQGSATATTDGGGIGRFSVVRSAEAFPAYTATLTSPDGGTSEFSQNDPALLTSPQADLVVSAFAPSTTVPVGGPVTLIETVTNNGPAVAEDVRLFDTMPVTLANVQVVTSRGTGSVDVNNVVTALIGALAPGQSATVTITGASAQAGPLVDAPGVFSSSLDPDYSNNSATQTITVSPDTNTPRADLAIIQVATPAVGKLGSNLTYTITVTNNGPAASTNATVTDTLPSTVTLVSATPSQGAAPSTSGPTVTDNLGTIAPGATATLTIVVKPTVNGTITNNANVSGGQFDPVPSNNTKSLDAVIGTPSTELAITQVATPVAGNVGGNLTFTVTVTNFGPGTATNATVTDVLPVSATLVGAKSSQGGTPTIDGSLYTENLGTIAPGATATITLVVRPTLAGTITNTAGVTGDQPDPNQANNSTSLNTVIGPESTDLAITEVATPAAGNVGGLLTYTLTVTNNGPSTSTNATVTDTLPANVTPIDATPSQGGFPVLNGSTITANLGTIAPGASATLSIIVRPNVAATITNTASVLGDQPDPVPANNSTSLNTVVNGASADLAIASVASSASGKVGTNLVYTVTVTNNGPSAATNVAVNDFLPASATLLGANSSQGTAPSVNGTLLTDNLGTIAPGATATLTITVRPTLAATITNSANVSGGQPDPVPSNDSTSLTTVVVNPNISLLLASFVPNQAGSVGTTQTFNLTVTNNGTDPATNVTIIDTLPTNATFVQAIPSQGAVPAPVNGAITDDLGTIPAGGQASLTIVVLLTKTGVVLNYAGAYTPDFPSVAPSFAYGGILAQPAPLGPSVTALSGSGSNSQLVLNFNMALNAKTATNRLNYVLIATGPKGKNRKISIIAASYNPIDHSVRIVPSAPLNSNQTYQLTVIGKVKTGIADTQGRRLVGTLGGAAGTNYTVNFLAGTLPQI